jgi:diguanylate cyclase (GGDEF)-like protein
VSIYQENKMHKQLFHLPENLTSQARNAFRLMLVFIGLSFAFLVFTGFQIAQSPSWQSWLLASEVVILLIVEVRALVLVRRGRHELGVWIVFVPIQLMLIVIPFLISGLGLVILFSAIMVGILFGNQTLPPRQARVLIFMGFVGGVAAFLVDLLIPIQRITLSGFQTFILVGIGILVVTYKKNSQLRDLAEILEKHVDARTEMLTAEVENRKLAEQMILRQNQLLTAAAEIASAITSTLELNKLLVISSELIREKFDFYHASVFLIEPGSNIAVLRASAGQVNRLPAGEHQLVIGSKSLVGRATATRQPVVVMDVTNDSTHLKNPLLPDTKAEAVIPLLIGELVCGALDVQSTIINAFSDWDVMILDTIADQLAIAVQNARLYTSIQQEVVERRHAEQALQFAKEELETQVKVRTAELSQANEQLQVELEERKRAEEKLVYTALHDPLTNLPNRVLLMDRLHHAMERAKRHKDNRFAILFLDLDRFKVVNDSLGHNIGDLLLIESTCRLSACLRGEDTVARLGGDEFVILLEDIQDPTDATRVADRIQHDVALPYVLEGHNVFVSVSMGIVLNEARYERPEDILRDADIAMYRAKGQGRGRYEMFDTTMLARAMTRLELESDLRKAVERQEFIIHYQPIVELGTQQIIGFEALVRWQHPTRGLVSPAEFIPMAEETGLIVPIGHWVLTEACHQIRAWQVQFPADPPLTVSVNLSTRQCAQTDLVQRVAEVLQSTGLNASGLKLELTESMIVEDAESTSDMLSELRALGVQVQIDDFGTGYSSLGYLQKLPIDTLKIDRTFVSRLGKDGSGSEIVQTILALAHNLGMKVVAEGIETDEQLAKLRSMQCEYGQGYLFNKPIDSQAAGILLAESLAIVVG